MRINVHNQTGETIGEVDLPDSVFGAKWNADLVHQAVRVSLANRRNVLAHAKGRGEVRGGGKKPWQQKGTGRARHGSRRSPIWRGGGVTHGPSKERNFALVLPKKMRRAAVAAVLSKKAREGEIVVLDTLAVDGGKTKRAAEILSRLLYKNAKPRISCLLLLAAPDSEIQRAFRNLARAKVALAGSVNILDLLNHKAVVMPQKAVGVLEKTLARS